MDRQRALFIIVAILCLADLTGALMLRDAWRARHDHAASRGQPVVRPHPIGALPAPEPMAGPSGT